MATFKKWNHTAKNKIALKLSSNLLFLRHKGYANKYVFNCFLKSIQFIFLIVQTMSTIMVIIFWDFLIFYQIFLSPQMKRSVIISNKHGIYELLYELPNDLRLTILGNYGSISKIHRIIAKFLVFLSNENFFNTSKNLLKNRNWMWKCPIWHKS